MEISTRKPLAIIMAVLLAALVIVIAGCESETGQTTSPPVITGAPVKLVFTAQPSGVVAGLPFDPRPAVAAVDEQGNIVTGYRGLAVITITEGTGVGGAQLFGGIKAGLVNGIVEFRGLSIDKAGPGYTLTVTCGTLEPATSKPFTNSPGAPYKLAFTVQPSGGVAGSPFTTQPEVTVQDSCGNTVDSYGGSVTMVLTFGAAPGGAVIGAATVQVVDSKARFTDLSLNRSFPEYKLTATSKGLIEATSDTFKITAAAPVKLEFTVQPSGAKAGTPFETQPKVAVADIYGNVVTTSRASVSVSITPNTGAAGAVLSGTQTLVAEGGLGGLAAFTDLSIDLAGSGYTLTASSSGLTSGTSQAFDVVAP